MKDQQHRTYQTRRVLHNMVLSSGKRDTCESHQVKGLWKEKMLAKSRAKAHYIHADEENASADLYNREPTPHDLHNSKGSLVVIPGHEGVVNNVKDSIERNVSNREQIEPRYRSSEQKAPVSFTIKTLRIVRHEHEPTTREARAGLKAKLRESAKQSILRTLTETGRWTVVYKPFKNRVQYFKLILRRKLDENKYIP